MAGRNKESREVAAIIIFLEYHGAPFKSCNKESEQILLSNSPFSAVIEKLLYPLRRKIVYGMFNSTANYLSFLLLLGFSALSVH